MTDVFVLQETLSDYSDDPIVLGVFERPKVSIEQIKSFYGDDAEIIAIDRVEDSGVEWVMTLRTTYEDSVRLAMFCFPLNEII